MGISPVQYLLLRVSVCCSPPRLVHYLPITSLLNLIEILFSFLGSVFLVGSLSEKELLLL